MDEEEKKKATKRIDDDVSRRRATSFSKRSRSLVRKAHKISAFCDADVALVAFSPSGLATKFSSGERIEDVLQQYVDLPAYQRYYNLQDVEEKLERLEQLDHIIEGDENKSHYLSNQIHHLKLQIKKSEVEIEILDANLSDYEVDPEQPSSYTLPQLLWCERNLNQAMQRVIHRKNLLLGNCSAAPYNARPFIPQRRAVLEMDGRPELDSLSPFGFRGNGIINRAASQCPNPSQLILKLDPWISPYSSKVRNSMLRDIINGFHPAGNGTRQFGESSFISSTFHSLEKNMPDFNLSPGFIPIAQHSRDVSELSTDPSPHHHHHHHGIPFEAEMGREEGFCSTTANQENEEDGFLEWDGFPLAENLNLDDLDIII